MIKHRFAENYRGLYNDYIDSLIDRVNENFNEQIEFNDKLDDTNLNQLKEYASLVQKTDDSFEFLISETDRLGV